MKVPTYFLILVVSTLTTAALPSFLDARSDLFAREDKKMCFFKAGLTCYYDGGDCYYHDCTACSCYSKRDNKELTRRKCTNSDACRNFV
ncbi:hypothetical protein Ptr902_06666 [Pyrenophora tritici-repentis]|nr:hypothetical protein Ptr902_06666 [Pyrenophora tritici-repentis]